MERMQKWSAESATAQRRFTSRSREGELQSKIDSSVAMTAQRQTLKRLFGGAIQRVEDEGPLQGKFVTAQRVEEEEPLQGKFEPVQRVEEEEPLQGKFEAVQRVEEEEPLQGKFAAASALQRKEEPTAKPNNTGLPDNLKNGIEVLSGMSMDNVKVHYNSSQPAQLNALAYAQGTDIHVAPGQEQHLPHEAWHVVQQAQGRVKPTMQMKEGVPVNDDAGLEHEADVMGGRAIAQRTVLQRALPHSGLANTKSYYNSQSGAKNKRFSGSERPASFSSKFKLDMVKNEWKGHYNANTDMWFVQTVGGSGVVLPTNAIQIDHTVPWDNIATRLNESPLTKLSPSNLNLAKMNGYVTPDGNSYTLYAARMYYHDVENLKPWAGSENAAKGAASFDETNTTPLNAISNKVARSAGIHHEMVVAAQQAYREWGHDVNDVKTMMGNIDEADAALMKAADNLNSM